MKKSFKKIAVTLISATLIMSMAAAMPTSAATTAGAQTKVTSQSVTMPQGTATYSIYQVASATYNDEGKIYTYKVNAPFAGVLDVDAETGLLKRDTVLVHSMSASQTQALAKALDAAKSGDSTSAAAGTGVDLAPGYYLIVGSSASVTAPMLISVDGEPIAPLTNKSSEITIDKTITAIDTAYGIDNVISEALFLETLNIQYEKGQDEVIVNSFIAAVNTIKNELLRNDKDINVFMVKPFVVTTQE